MYQGNRPITRDGHPLPIIRSMLQKAIRRCDVKYAAYSAFQMWQGYSNYLWKTFCVISAEDCYGIMTKEIMALWEADEKVNKGKKEQEKSGIFMAKALTLLCYARKSRDADFVACKLMSNDTDGIDTEKYIDPEEYKQLSIKTIPDYVYDCHTYEGKKRGKTKEDFFREEEAALQPKQLTFFDIEGYKNY